MLAPFQFFLEMSICAKGLPTFEKYSKKTWVPKEAGSVSGKTREVESNFEKTFSIFGKSSALRGRKMTTLSLFSLKGISSTTLMKVSHCFPPRLAWCQLDRLD